MRANKTPPHPGASGVHDDDMMGDDMEDTFDDDDLIEIHDDDENEGTDLGDFADDEEDDMDGEGLGMEGFTGQKPDYILTSHQESAVFCCSFDGTGNRLISGGEDDVANIWDNSSIKSQSPICVCRGHKDSVVSASFSWDSTFCCTADLSGIVKVWKVANNELLHTFETGELSWSFWHFGSNVLFAGCDDGSIYMWKINTGDCKIYSGSSAKCEHAALLPDGKRLLAGYACGTLKLFDLKSGETLFNFTKGLPNPSPILCVAAHSSKNLVAAGSADGTVKLFNSQNGKLLQTVSCTPVASEPNTSSVQGEDETVESIVFSPSETGLDYVACGTVTGHVVVWDVATLTERFRIQQDSGLTKVLWDPRLSVMYTAGLDGVVRAIDVRSGSVDRLLGRHRTEILDICITKDGSKLASASEDGSVFIYNLLQAPST
ncbi:unnamed protein product [Orchesella dallaii]|uniref:Pyrrolo-quinoline quinone repeat domain-containing protein n=1 Tax=Orchesella dallaii TaxID=48710 RepID=A0ABP1RTD6_9HEXA